MQKYTFNTESIPLMQREGQNKEKESDASIVLLWDDAGFQALGRFSSSSRCPEPTGPRAALPRTGRSGTLSNELVCQAAS